MNGSVTKLSLTGRIPYSGDLSFLCGWHREESRDADGQSRDVVAF